MSKRLIRLLLIFLLLSLMGTPVQAMDCEWVSKLKTNAGTEILREEYEQLLKKIASYSVCIDNEIKNILSEMSSSATRPRLEAPSICCAQTRPWQTTSSAPIAPTPVAPSRSLQGPAPWPPATPLPTTARNGAVPST